VSAARRGLPSARVWRGWRPRLSLLVVLAVCVSLLAPVAGPAARAQAQGWHPREPQTQRSVPGHVAKAKAALPDPGAKYALHGAPKVSWPAPGTAVADLTPAAGTDQVHTDAAGPREARAGRLPVWVGPPAVSGSAREAHAPKAAVPDRVRVRVLDRSAADRARITGLGMRFTPLDQTAPGGTVSVDVDYSGFRFAYGGDWGSRLRLVKLPSCALTDADKARCQTRTPLRTTNDTKTGHLTAQLPMSAAGVLLAAEAAPSGPAGDYKATSLSPSSTWGVSTQSGSFSWSYPMRVPPAPGGPAPSVGIGYSSGSVDGRTVATNNQTSGIGEGFDYWPGFIERHYRNCADDGVTPKRNDQCWRYDNATMSLNGQATELIRDDATGKWQPKNDDGSKVEKLTGTTNGDNDGEYWRVTTTDGTQYYFGLNRLPGWADGKTETNSTWTEPVYGNDENEPCHKSTGFDDSWCQQAWRWNLDYVVDPHGTVSTFWYKSETNYYRRDVTTLTDGQPNGTPTAYDRGGYLTHIDYGQRSNAIFSSSAPGRVSFTNDERCIPTADFDCAASKFTKDNASHWPDVPYDQNCDQGEDCVDRYAPTFWTRKRISAISTQVLNGGSYEDVDTWTLDQQMRAPGDGTAASLWLDKIEHKGNVGGTASVPDVSFGGVQMANRVDSLEGLPPLTKWRVSAIDNETGGSLSITYSDKECVAGQTPQPDANTKRCYPQYWSPENATKPQLDWFHKYVVTEVQQIDRTGGAPKEVTDYQYLDGGAWHHDDDDGLTDEKYKTWSQWRGFGKVRVIHGDASEQQSQTDYLFFRGMDGDELDGGGTRSVQVTDSEGTALDDTDRLAGLTREEIHYDGPGGSEVNGTIYDPWARQTGKRVRSWGTSTSDLVEVGATHTRDALSGGGWRRTSTATEYNNDGLPTQATDYGDTSTSADNQCTRTTYARDDGKWMIASASEVEVVSKACSQTPTRPDDVLSDVRKSYDGQSWGTAPTKGDVTATQKLGTWDASGPHYVTVSGSTFDVYGRPLVVTDATGHKSTNTYTPATGAVTQTTETDAIGSVTTTVVDPAWGQPIATIDGDPATTDPNKRTDLDYDPLGRLTAVWLPGRAKSTHLTTPSMKFGYTIRSNAPTTVSTSTLRNDGATYTTGYALYDGLLRPRQTQQPAPGGGRLVSDTIYDTRGLVAKTNQDYYNELAPGSDLWLPPSDDDVPGQTVTQYNGMEWPTAQIFRKRGSEQWRTTTTYDGDRTTVDPPDGSTPTTTLTDARGQTTEVRQYKGDGPSGDYDATTYTYTPAGQVKTVKDAQGSTWTYHYDLRGRQIQIDDPDRGTTTLAYDDADRVTTVTDARGKSQYATYDAIGRKTALYEGTDDTGTKLAGWTYDTLPDGTSVKGQPVSSTRYVPNGSGGTDQYTSTITAYDAAHRPTGVQVTIPASEGKLAGTYKTTTDYNLDGTIHRTVLPPAGGLPGETLLYDYDELQNPTTLHGLTDYVTSTSYSKLGQVLQMTRSDGGPRVLETNTYEDGTNRLKRSVTERETAPISVDDLNYTYDDSGNIREIADTPPGQTADVQCFRQDYLQRLTSAWTATDDCATTPTKDNANTIVGGAAPYWQSFSYDTVGNRTGETDHDPAGDTSHDVTRTFTYAGPDKAQPHTLTSVSYQGGPRDGQSDAYQYDAAGNTTQRGTGHTLAWDDLGQLIKSTDSGDDTTYVYDASGNRLISRDKDSATLFLPGLEVRLNKATNTTSATRYYSFAGETVAIRTRTGLSWPRTDNHGTADTTVDSVTQAVTRRYHTPFGGERGTPPSSWPGTQGFLGGATDPGTGLTHLGARDYDPDTGRFLSVDPLFDQGDPQSWNGYAYADNAPVTKSDPSGTTIMIDPCAKFSCSNTGSTQGGPPSSPPPPPAPKRHCGYWSFCQVTNYWNQHKATIVNVTVTIVVTGSCLAVTEGAGSVGCAALGGAAGNLAGYYVSTPVNQWDLGDAFKAEATGAVAGAAGEYAGKGTSALLGKVADTRAGNIVTKAVTKAADKAKNALGRGGGGAADDAADGAGAGAADSPGADAPQAAAPRTVPTPRGAGGKGAPVVEVEHAPPGWSAKDRLEQLEARVPTFAVFARSGRRKARTFVGAINLDTGDTVLASSGGQAPCNSYCAEGNALLALGGNPANVRFTRAWTFNWEEMEAVEKEVCKNCQADYPPPNFVLGVVPEAGGAWGR
jgi:RHS repeat-associated protein